MMTGSRAQPLMLTARPALRPRGLRLVAALGIALSCTAAFATMPAGRDYWIGRRLTIPLANPIPLDKVETAAPFAFDTQPIAGAFPFHAGVQSPLDSARAQLCLTSAIYYESASESEDGQRAVAQVVLNRVRHPAFPNSVCGVVFQGSELDVHCQFSFTCDGAMLRQPSRAGWATASRIAREALAGSVYAPVGMATHYHTLAVSPNWAPTLTNTVIVGAHIFYRMRGANGEQAAFRQAYAMREPLPGPYPKRVLATAPVPLTLPIAPYPDAALPAVAPAPVARDVQPEFVGSGAPLAPYQDSVADAQIRPEWRDSGTWIKR